MKTFFRENWGLILLIVLAGILRFTYLGYSDFQGDEFKALFRPEAGQSNLAFLFDQRKGPIQFIITYLLSFFDHDFRNQLLMRFPFAVASLISVYYFYLLVQKHFNKKVAFYATFFFLTNGFLVAFSRIVQYQSFVILFMVLALWFFSLAVETTHSKKEWKVWGIYLGFISWALSLLSHYDAILIAPFAFFLLFKWFRVNGFKSLFSWKHFMGSTLLSGALLMSFYIPFVLALTQGTQDYWLDRISGGSGKISSSIYLFQVYHPVYVIHVYYLLGFFGLLSLFLLHPYDLLKNSRILFSNFRQYFRLYIKGLLDNKMLFLVLWFLGGFIFMEGLVNVPGTHIYTYLIPAFILMGVGIYNLELLLNLILPKKITTVLFSVGVFLIFSFVYAQVYAVFVDHTYEYPWENEKFLIFEFQKPNATYHLSMFGFPYYRHWEEISDFITDDSKDAQSQVYFSTNEKEAVVRNHITLPKDTTKAGYYVYIERSQNFSYVDNGLKQNKKAYYWASKYEPIRTFTNGSRETVKIYKMEPGTLDELILKGF